MGEENETRPNGQSATEVEKAANTIAGIIPQLFFDLIARIIPGPVIVGSLLLVFPGTGNVVSKHWEKIFNFVSQNTLISFSVSLLFFYSASVIFYGLWFFIANVFLKIARKIPGSIFKTIGFSEINDAGIVFSLAHDYIKLEAPVAGGRITKLKAEIHMSGALTVAFSLCAMVEIFFVEGNQITYLFVAFLLAAVGAFFSNYHYCHRLARSVDSYAIQLSFDYETKKKDYDTYKEWKETANKE